MINTITFRNLRNAEYLQFGKDASSLISSANPKTLGFEKPALAYAATIAAIDDSFKLEQGSGITQQIIDLDEQRDNLLHGIYLLIDGYAYHFNAAVVDAANLISRNLDTYGRGVTKVGYQSETASIDSMLKDWQTKPELTAAASLLHIDEWAAQLQIVNANFATAYENRVKEAGQQASITALRDARNSNVVIWNKLCTAIQGQAIANEEDAAKAPAYTSLINELNALISTYNNTLQIRKSKNATPPPTPPTP